MKGVFLWLFRWARRTGTRDFCPALATLVVPLFSLTVHYFTLFFPIAQQAGKAVVPRRLSIKMCLWALYLETQIL
jgi:hypothetical protein